MDDWISKGADELAREQAAAAEYWAKAQRRLDAEEAERLRIWEQAESTAQRMAADVFQRLLRCGIPPEPLCVEFTWGGLDRELPPGRASVQLGRAWLIQEPRTVQEHPGNLEMETSVHIRGLWLDDQGVLRTNSWEPRMWLVGRYSNAGLFRRAGVKKPKIPQPPKDLMYPPAHWDPRLVIPQEKPEWGSGCFRLEEIGVEFPCRPRNTSKHCDDCAPGMPRVDVYDGPWGGSGASDSHMSLLSSHMVKALQRMNAL